MDKISQISLKNTVSVQMACTLNEDILVSNFGIIIDCLKDLSDKQNAFDKELKDLNSLKEQLKNLNDRVSSMGDRIDKGGDSRYGSQKKESSGSNNQKSITGGASNNNGTVEKKENGTGVSTGNVLGNVQKQDGGKRETADYGTNQNGNSSERSQNNNQRNNLTTQNRDQNNQSSNQNNDKNGIQNSNNNDSVVKKEQSKESSSHEKVDLSGINNNLAKLAERVTKNQGNIDDSIKDINSVFKDINEIRQLLKGLGKGQIETKFVSQISENRQRDSLEKNQGTVENTNNRSNFDISSIRNIHAEISKNNEAITSLTEELQKMKERVRQNERDIAELKDRPTINNLVIHKEGGRQLTGDSDQKINNLNAQIEDLRDKLDILGKKLAINILETNQNTGQISGLKEDSDESKKENGERKLEIEELRESIRKLFKELSDLHNYHEKDIKSINDQLNNLKNRHGSEHKNTHTTGGDGGSEFKKINSNTSLGDELKIQKNHLSVPKQAQTQSKFRHHDHNDGRDALRQLRERIELLEKLVGSRQNMGEDRSNPEKLPMIKKALRVKETGPDKSYYSAKRDMNDLKTEIQLWVKNYSEQSRERDNLDGLLLQFQEIRNILNRKADQEGMRKGLSFLENKINQLYLFLTEPDAEDAMIVRKGFNCLSCSKKVEKLRGRLGPNINWNNMTQTNYSPPRVGYSKPMGDNSIDKDYQ